MASPPSAPPSGPGGPGIGGSITIDQVTLFIKEHYIEILVWVLLVYLGYQAIMMGSKYIFKPAYLVDPDRGTKRFIGRTMYSKVVMGQNKYEEFRAFIKDGWFKPIIPHLFADMDRVNILANAILLDFRSVVYDHERKMFVGSLTGVKDMRMDGLAVQQRVKEKFAMIDVAVSMAVRGSPSISQHNMIHNAIPLPDGYYEEDISKLSSGRMRGLLPPGMRPGDDAENMDHVERVIHEKEAKKHKVRPIKRRPEPIRKHRYVVGGPEDQEDGVEEEDTADDTIDIDDDIMEGPPPFITTIEKMPLKDKLLGRRSPIDDMVEEGT